ncbi:TolC family protein [Flavobacterium haoranii]|uniref:Outer membrane protein TolC n=1 Tax=Flavobacterium haoranii TaxID=683124 RepID=A0A1M6D9E3_9FLAO|nr:TolC family protein [Flavobacterium haoranii]SHI69842.1 Outer membrane protein TolC [Flavobacterium haoranii]
MKFKFLIAFLFIQGFSWSQDISNELTYEEFIGYVKKFHPLAKQANLKISEGQAKLMKARGAFDPKIEASYNEKQYGDKQYYSFFNGSFKIPTWYGIEIKAAFDNNEGIYINPENTLPNSGLTSVGITVPIGQGLWINERMAELKQAKLYQNVAIAEQSIMLTEVLYQASISYINWKQSFDEVKLYEEYLENAKVRYNGIVKSIELGDKPAIDSVEVGITLNSRKLSLEKSRLKLTKARYELSNHLWTENNIPLEIDESLYPESNLALVLPNQLNLENLENVSIEQHPKLSALQSKLDILKVDRRLQGNKILPKLEASYNYLSEPSAFDDYRFEDYKIGVNFSVPLFLRKERAQYKLAKLQVQDSEFGFATEKVSLNNKIEAQKKEINSYKKQIDINRNLVNNYNTMLDGEDKLFVAGESSVFLINSRENSLVSAQLATISLENAYLSAFLNLFKTLGKPE